MILICNEHPSRELVNMETEKAWLSNLAITHGYSIGEMNYIFVDDERLLEMNKAHLGHDYYTDIITFPYQEEPIVSDVFISLDRIAENADTFQVEFMMELRRVMAHGLLHLLGYDDHTPEDVEMMRQAESNALAGFDK